MCLVKFCLLVTVIVLVSGCTSQSDVQQIPRDAIPADAVKVTPGTDAHPPLLHSTQWEQPVPVTGINTAGAEDSPFVLPDGKTLFFWFTPDVDIPAEEQVHDGVTGIYVSKKAQNQWSTPERVILQDPGKVAMDGCEFVQGNIMWFCSIREGNCRDIDIYTAEFNDGKWRNWKNAGEKLNCIYEIGELHISADGDELYFHSGKAGGKGQYDIWVTRKIDGEWQQPENVEAVNTPEHEGWPFLTEDGTELWFTRTYKGTAAIFRSIQVNGQWGEPEVIISQFAGEPSLDSKGNIYFTHHFFKEGNVIEADIYVAYSKGEEGGSSVLAPLSDITLQDTVVYAAADVRVIEKRLYICATDGMVYCIQVGNGEILWVVDTESRLYTHEGRAPPYFSAVGNILLVYTEDGHICAISVD